MDWEWKRHDGKNCWLNKNKVNVLFNIFHWENINKTIKQNCDWGGDT